MLSHKTVSDKRQRKGALSRIRGFLKSALRGAPAPDPPIDYLAVGESTAGSGRCVCQARGVAGWGPRWPCRGWWTMENAAQLPAGMFADCHFHLTCSFFLPPHPPIPPYPGPRDGAPPGFSPSCRDRAKRWHPRPQKRQAARVVPASTPWNCGLNR